MSESQVAKLQKPKQLRGLLHSQIKRNLCIAIALTVFAGASWKFLYADSRKQKYADFYKNYDAEKEFERMRKKGLFQSCSPDDE